MSGVERTRIDTERNFLHVIDKVHEISSEAVDSIHVFTLSQVYEDLLLKMGEKGNDGGQFFTPREVIRAMDRTVAPAAGETVYDPACGTGGFLAQSYDPRDATAQEAQPPPLRRSPFSRSPGSPGRSLGNALGRRPRPPTAAPFVRCGSCRRGPLDSACARHPRPSASRRRFARQRPSRNALGSREAEALAPARMTAFSCSWK